MIISKDQQLELRVSENEMKWFKDAKFGIFIHWGPALHVTNSLSWGRNGERPGAGRPASGGVPPEIYDNQYKIFNPIHFDAEKWMEQIKSFGASYLVFTAKHHDGFCFFDASNSDYDIMSTPFGKDICRLLAQAAQKNGIKLFWYYSQPDWTHPDCLRKHHYDNYLPYMKEHILQLFSDYGPIDGIFWDGIASKYWQWDTYHLLKKMKELHPGLLSNPRTGSGWPDNKNRGDYDTPELSLGPTDHHRYWEACITMTDKWLYNPEGPVKTFENILPMLITSSGNGGNLLLNLGPDGTGLFRSVETKELKKLGKWLNIYGETIFKTRRGPYISGNWGVSTQKGDKIYLHFLQKIPEGTKAEFKLPTLASNIFKVEAKTPGFKGYTIENDSIIIKFNSDAYRKNEVNIIEFTCKELNDSEERISTWHAKHIKSNELSIAASSWKSEKFHPEVILMQTKNVFTEGVKLKSWWQPKDTDKKPWISIKLNEGKRIQTVLLSENMRSHSVRDFELEVLDETGIWIKVYNGNTIGDNQRIKLNGNKIFGVRLSIINSTHRCQITNFKLYE